MLEKPWQRIPIEDSGEPLERLVPDGRIVVEPMYRQLGYSEALSEIYLRAGVIERLKLSATALPDGHALLIWDGWRPLDLQTRIYHQYRDTIIRESSLHGDALQRRVEQFVSVPSSDPARPSPHLTGGAVDLSLADAKGERLEMGSEFDELTDRSRTDYYEDDTEASSNLIRERRKILLEAMNAGGFTNFASEWWHFDYGNQFWASRTDATTAIYGIASPR